MLENSNSEDEEVNFRRTNAIVSLSALLIFSIGMGGVKSNLSVMGADQYRKGHVKTVRRLDIYFMVFYVLGNAATCLAFYIGPMVRNMNCGAVGFTSEDFDEGDQCYSCMSCKKVDYRPTVCFFFQFATFCLIPSFPSSWHIDNRWRWTICDRHILVHETATNWCEHVPGGCQVRILRHDQKDPGKLQTQASLAVRGLWEGRNVGDT